MTTWDEIITYASQLAKGEVEAIPAPRIQHHTLEDWKGSLNPELYHIAFEKGTQKPDFETSCTTFEQGVYTCACCDALLFEANTKYDSQSGWPSFTQAIHRWAIGYELDHKLTQERVEVHCNTCGAHLGHVFPDGPAPSGLRYCINQISLKATEHPQDYIGTVVFGGGCFWCTEGMLKEIKGVIQVEVGYAGGHTLNPTYKEVCGGDTGHAEVVRITFDKQSLSYSKLLAEHMFTHDPTTLNRQGVDQGTQYRSIIFYQNEQEKIQAEHLLLSLASSFEQPIVTTIEPLETFYKAEDYHQNYFELNPENQYCCQVVAPKIAKAKKIYHEKNKL